MSEITTQDESGGASPLSQQREISLSGIKLRPEIDQLLDDVTARLRRWGEVECTDTEVHFKGRYWATTISVRNVGLPTLHNGVIKEQLIVTTRLPESLKWSAKLICCANLYAALSALIADPTGKTLSLVSRINTYERQEDSLSRVADLLFFAALLHGDGWAAGYNAMADLSGEDAWPIWEHPQRNKPSRWGVEELWLAMESLRGQCVRADGTNDEMRVWLPWGAGRSAVADDTRSGLCITTTQAHPILGNGFYYQLDLPVCLERDRLFSSASRLNLLERDALDAPPLLGAWTADTRSECLSYNGFLPNALRAPESVRQICAWMVDRNRLARAFVMDQAN